MTHLFRYSESHFGFIFPTIDSSYHNSMAQNKPISYTTRDTAWNTNSQQYIMHLTKYASSKTMNDKRVIFQKADYGGLWGTKNEERERERECTPQW